jgi:hypothetical protein
MPVAQRVPSLQAVGETIAGGGEFPYALRDFLDGFYEKPDGRALIAEPPAPAGIITTGARLAAVSEHFCRMHGWPLPGSARQPSR